MWHQQEHADLQRLFIGLLIDRVGKCLPRSNSLLMNKIPALRFHNQQKENPNWFCEKVEKTLGEIKKGNQGSLYFFIPGRASLMILSWCLDRRCGWRPSSIYSWSIGHILEHEFFCLGHLGSSGSKEKKVDLSYSEQLLRVVFSTFCGQKIFLKILQQPH